MSLLPSSSSVSRKDYGVFLSFRGEDTRKNFTDHFYHNLVDSGIVTFRDKERLETGKDIASGLLKAIQQSSSAVIILSENYASSAWCLEELAEIVKEKEEKGIKVFPIFYHVDPSDLRRQKGKVGEAFAKHEERYKEEDTEKIQKWRNALTQVANMSGWDFNDQYESEFIREKVKRISAELCQTYPIIQDGLVGIGSRLEEVKSKLQIGKDDVRIIGICGMGGIGKTTLAIVVCNQMSPHFEAKCFIANVREVLDRCGLVSGLVSLQKQLLTQILNEGFNFFNDHEGKAIISHRLSHKKVLIVLDDVDKLQQLECLVGSRKWFGPGSRIIVTTRDEGLLRSHRVDDVYKVETLNHDDALRLFLSKAFDDGAVPNDDLMELSRRVVGYARGLPLALKVLGSYFGGIDATAAQWRSAIERLERDSNKDIIDILRISYDSLEENLKNIFLDVACFFDYFEDKTIFVRKILDGCEFSASIGIYDLVKKSLLDYDNFGLVMHDLLREMGRKIVREKSMKEPGKRSRLWNRRDVDRVLTADTATNEIECIVIPRNRISHKTLDLSVDAFSKMKILRLLRIHCFTSCDYLNYLSNELRLLDWYRCPLRSFPPSFQPHNLVALLLRYSRIEQLWQGSVRMDKLKQIDLSGSQYLIKTPDFTEAPNLEVLNLQDCTSLIDVHPSIAVHKRVKILSLGRCTSLRRLPPKIRMNSLEKLTLSGCTNFERFPEIDGKMEHLRELNLSGCYNIENLREVLGQAQLLSSLRRLILRDCNLGDGDIPTESGCQPSLKYLDLSGNHFINLMPLSFDRFPKLCDLNLSNCKELKSLPGLLTTIESVRTDC